MAIPRAGDVGIPARVFLYTLDQIATLLDVELQALRTSYIHFDGRTLGAHKKDRMMARNIAPLGERPDWRVAEAEFVRWMKLKRYKFHERGWVEK